MKYFFYLIVGLAVFFAEPKNASAKSNPFNEVVTTLSKDSVVLGLPLKEGVEVSFFISNTGSNVGQVERAEAKSEDGFELGAVTFQSPITIRTGKPSVWLGAYNIGDSDVYHVEAESDVDLVTQVSGELKNPAVVGGIHSPAGAPVSYFCYPYGGERICDVDRSEDWHVVYAQLAESMQIDGVKLLENDLVYFHPLKERNKLLAFTSESFRPVSLNHDELQVEATLQARGAIFNVEGFTTALYTKAGEKLLGVSLEQTTPRSVASVEIRADGSLALFPQIDVVSMVEGFPIGIDSYEPYPVVRFTSDGRLRSAKTLGEFSFGGIAFRGENTLKLGENQLSLQAAYGGDYYEGSFRGVDLFLHRALFTFARDQKVIDLTCELSPGNEQCNYIDDEDFKQRQREAGRVIEFSVH